VEGGREGRRREQGEKEGGEGRQESIKTINK
jgi:hypothetical protein